MANHGPYLLLADDDKDDCIIFKEALQEVNPEVHFVSTDNGHALIELLNSATILPDIIFLDINMPLKNGKECLVELKQDSQFNDIAIIVYSTSTNPKDVDETYNAGANLYLEKPYTFSSLTKVLSDLLELDWSKYKPQPTKDKFVWYTH